MNTASPWREYSPQWAPHIKGRYQDRTVDEDGIPEEAPVEAECTVCNTKFRRMCASGLMRQHISTFAVAHAHRDALKTGLPGGSR
jgi:hypothetical protein